MASQRIARGIAYLTGQRVTFYFVAFAFYVGIARFLPQGEVGRWSVLMAVNAAFSTFTLFGLYVAAQKYVSERQATGDLAGAATSLRVTVKLGAYVAIPTLVITSALSLPLSHLILGTSDCAIVLLLIFVGSGLLNFATLLNAEMLGLGLYLEAALQNTLFILVSRGLSLLLACAGLGLLGLALGWLIGAVFSFAISIRLTWHKLPQPSLATRKLCSEIIAYSYPVWLLDIITFGQEWADITILYAMTGDAASTGIYYLAASGSKLLGVFWAAIAIVMLPAMAAAKGKGGIEATRPLFRSAGRLLNFLVVPFGVCLAAISRTAVSVVYGPSYASGVIPFAILASTAIFPAYYSTNASALQAIAETKAVATAGAISAAVGILLVSILAKPFGAVGAASARAVTYIIACLATEKALTARTEMAIDRRHLLNSLMIALAAATALMSMDYVFTDLWKIHWLPLMTLEGVVFSVIYVLALRQRRLVEAGDMKLLREALPHELHGFIDKVERIVVYTPRPC